jgi:glucose-6-phosphate-specific signal transduction histidine kinase
MWANRVKQLVLSSYNERQKTENTCARLQRLAREGMNEIWQHANVSTNAFVARVDDVEREKTELKSTVAQVRARLLR